MSPRCGPGIRLWLEPEAILRLESGISLQPGPEVSGLSLSLWTSLVSFSSGKTCGKLGHLSVRRTAESGQDPIGECGEPKGREEDGGAGGGADITHVATW